MIVAAAGGRTLQQGIYQCALFYYLAPWKTLYALGCRGSGSNRVYLGSYVP